MKTVCALPLLAAPLATLAAVPTAPAGFAFSTLNSNACPGDSSPMTTAAADKEKCEDVVNAPTLTGYTWDSSGEHSQSKPKGCFCETETDMRYCTYNTHETGGANGVAFMVCKSLVPAPTPPYVHSTVNVNECPAGSSPLTDEEQCEEFVSGLDEYYWGMDLDTDDLPKGCVCEADGSSSPQCYYNNHVAGRAEETSFLACKSDPQDPTWDLELQSVASNFTAGATSELEVTYVAETAVDIAVKNYKTCDGDTDEISADGVVFDRDRAEESVNDTFTKYKYQYGFNKSAMVGSGLWNEAANELKFCQVTQLRTNGTDSAKWVIVEDRLMLNITFDLTAEFKLGVNLTKGTIAIATETVQFGVDAYNCVGGDEDSFVPENTKLAPSTQLAICVVPANDAVIIADVAEMVLKQVEGGVLESVPIIANDGLVEIEAITTKNNAPSEGTIVKTMVPLSKFSFDIGKFLNISGTAKLQLNGTSPTGTSQGGARRLRTLVGEDDQAVGDTEESGFALSITLQREAEGFGPIGSSGGHAIVGKGLVAFGLAVVAAIGLVM